MWNGERKLFGLNGVVVCGDVCVCEVDVCDVVD